MIPNSFGEVSIALKPKLVKNSTILLFNINAKVKNEQMKYIVNQM